MNLMPQESWRVTCYRYVGYIDIMGFKDMVQRSDHATIYAMMKKIEECQKRNSNIKWSNIEEKLVTTTSYSDSIMIYSKDNSFEALHAFSFTISGIIKDLFNNKIPFKGAVAYGTMTLDTERSIFFGQPLIDSYLLQDELLLYGVIVHGSAEKEIIKHESKVNQLFLTNYLCPLKNGASTHLTIHSIAAGPYSKKEENNIDFEKLLTSINSLRHKTSGYLRKYIDNTEQYLKYVKNQYYFEPKT